MFQKYVVGFAFSANFKSILLIEKQKPPRQVGLLNGIGGKIEINESSIHAMIRECKEEAGVDLPWKWVGLIKGHDFKCHLFSCATDDIYKAKQMEAEIIKIRIIDTLIGSNLIVDNLNFIVPYCEHVLRSDSNIRMEITYP